MNKAKEFFEDHKTGIAAVVSLITGIAIGGTIMHVKHGKYRELEKVLDKYPVYENGMSLGERILKYITNGPKTFYITGNPGDTMGDIADIAKDIRDIYEAEEDNLNDKLVGAIFFTKTE
jgi:hypothetical protein